MVEPTIRLVLMGTGPFAVPSFRQIHRTGYTILGVVTKPPKGKPSRDKENLESPVMLWAQDAGLPISTPDSINSPDSIAWLTSLQPDLLVVCDYGQILSNEALGTARLGGINLHGSLLPRHRGAAPVQWSILAGDELAGVSVIHMTPKLDAGPILEQVSTTIRPEENAEQLEVRLSQLGVEPTLKAIATLASLENDSIDNPTSTTIQQSRELVTKAPRLSKGDGQFDPCYPLELIDRQLRGLQPWPGLFGNLILSNGKMIRTILYRARPVPLSEEMLEQLSASPGQVLFGEQALRAGLPIDSPKQWIGIVVQDGVLVIELLQLAGKQPMQGVDFVSGYGRQTGLRFEQPTDPHPLLEKMMGRRSL